MLGQALTASGIQTRRPTMKKFEDSPLLFSIVTHSRCLCLHPVCYLPVWILYLGFLDCRQVKLCFSSASVQYHSELDLFCSNKYIIKCRVLSDPLSCIHSVLPPIPFVLVCPLKPNDRSCFSFDQSNHYTLPLLRWSPLPPLRTAQPGQANLRAQRCCRRLLLSQS